MNKETIMAEEYAAQLLQDRSSISSSEFPLENDNDYWLSFLLTATYDEEASPYVLHLGNGQVKRGRYSIPNMTISRR